MLQPIKKRKKHKIGMHNYQMMSQMLRQKHFKNMQNIILIDHNINQNVLKIIHKIIHKIKKVNLEANLITNMSVNQMLINLVKH